MELVVARHLLRDAARRAALLEDDEVAQEVQKAPVIEGARQHHLQLGHPGGRIFAAGDRPPGLEPLLARTERTDARRNAVGHDERGVGREEGGHLGLICLQLLDSRFDGRILVCRVLQLDDCERQPVNKKDNIRASRVLALGHRELVDRQPIVVLGRVEVDHPRLRASDGPVLATVFDRDAVDEHAVHGAVALDQGGRVDARQLAARVVQGLRGQGRVEAREGFPQPAF